MIFICYKSKQSFFSIGLVETSFARGDLCITLVDVGGQRSERRKWLYCFAGVNAIAFVVAMSEYDQILSDDLSTNRMKESINVFKQICNNRLFIESPMILFLNKKDVFEEKIVYSPISQCFPEYDDNSKGTEAASQFILLQFKKENKSNRQIFCHFTNAKDTENVNFIFQVIVDIILHSQLESLGFE